MHHASHGVGLIDLALGLVGGPDHLLFQLRALLRLCLLQLL